MANDKRSTKEYRIRVTEQNESMEQFKKELGEKHKDSLGNVLSYKEYHTNVMRETGKRPSKYPTPSDFKKIEDIKNGTVIEGYKNPLSNGKILYLFKGCAYINPTTDATCKEMEFFSREMGTDSVTASIRVAPEVTYKEMMDDALNGYLWILENGYKAENIIFSGDSSGMGTAIATALVIRDKGLKMPSMILGQTPWLNVAMDSASYTVKRDVDFILGNGDLLKYANEVYLDKSDIHNPYICTCYADLTDFPPILVQIGTDDITYDDSCILRKQAEKAGVELRLEVYEGMFHEFMLFRELDASQIAWDSLNCFVTKHIGVR